MGALTGLNTIITNNLNPKISSFFFCTLLFYLFFEVFFSFVRKLLQKNLQFIQMISTYICLVFIKFLVVMEKIKAII
jgi:hypothetical protein